MKKWCNQAFSTRSQFPWLQWNSSICWEMKNGIEDCSFMIKGHVPGNPATTIQAYKAYKHVNICIYVTYVCMYFAWMSVCTYVWLHFLAMSGPCIDHRLTYIHHSRHRRSMTTKQWQRRRWQDEDDMFGGDDGDEDSCWCFSIFPYIQWGWGRT